MATPSPSYRGTEEETRKRQRLRSENPQPGYDVGPPANHLRRVHTKKILLQCLCATKDSINGALGGYAPPFFQGTVNLVYPYFQSQAFVENMAYSAIPRALTFNRNPLWPRNAKRFKVSKASFDSVGLMMPTMLVVVTYTPVATGIPSTATAYIPLVIFKNNTMAVRYINLQLAAGINAAHGGLQLVPNATSDIPVWMWLPVATGDTCSFTITAGQFSNNGVSGVPVPASQRTNPFVNEPNQYGTCEVLCMLGLLRACAIGLNGSTAGLYQSITSTATQHAATQPFNGPVNMPAGSGPLCYEPLKMTGWPYYFLDISLMGDTQGGSLVNGDDTHTGSNYRCLVVPAPNNNPPGAMIAVSGAPDSGFRADMVASAYVNYTDPAGALMDDAFSLSSSDFSSITVKLCAPFGYEISPNTDTLVELAFEDITDDLRGGTSSTYQPLF